MMDALMVLRKSCGRPAPNLLAFAFLVGVAAFPLPAAGRERAEAGEEQREIADRPAERAEWNAALRRDSEGRLLSENRLRALREACDMPVDPSMAADPAGSFSRSDAGPSVRASLTFGGTVWQPLGPLPMQSRATSHQNWGLVAGRVDAIAIHPTDPRIMLIGAATGGIWKSTDSGNNWRPVSDSAPSLAVSSIVFAPSNPSIVFAATGEVDNVVNEFKSTSLGTYLGAGLLRSVDGGETWSRIDVNLPSNSILSRVLVQPNNSQNLMVGVYVYQNVAQGALLVGNIWRSTDGGVHFTKSSAPSGSVSDLVQDPNDPLRVYMATGRCNGCPAYGVFGSIDFGATWVEAFTTATPLGNVKLGISKTIPSVLYASILATDDTHGSLGGIYLSTDAGVHWQKRSVDPSMCPPSGSPLGNNQCSYDHWVAPDPFNPSTVYFGSIDLYKSTDGAFSWANILNAYAETGPTATTHPDQHVAAFAPGGALFVGNDGGVYRSTNGGASFDTLNATLDVAQFNGVALHPANPSLAIGGTQDNGSQRFTGSVVWSQRTLGDGGFNLIRSDSPGQILNAHYFAYMEYSTDGGSTFRDVSNCTALMNCTTNEGAEPMAFYPPATAAPLAPGTVFFGTNRVWANLTFGSDPTKWQPLSNGPITSLSNDVLTALEAAGDLNGPIWAGSRGGSVFFRPAGDTVFHSVGSGLPAAIVTRIVSVSADGRNAYLTFGGFLGAPSRHVWRTADGGTSWSNISSNLPDVPTLSLAVDPKDPTDLFVGSDVGVFRSTNGGASWATFNSGLPNVSVNDLRFHATSGDLWAATYGRGVWRVTAPAAGPPQSLALSGGRVQVTVDWQSQYTGQSGTAFAIPQQDGFGFFYFTDPNNPEVFVKVLDFGAGGALCFVGGLSDFFYKVTFKTLRTGQTLVFQKPAGQYVGFADNGTLKFGAQPPLGRVTAAGSASTALTFAGTLDLARNERWEAGREDALAVPPQSLTLAAGRVLVVVDWQSQYTGQGGRAFAIPQGDGFGFFYFTDPNNPEVFVKVLDFGGGGALCFVGGLSDFFYKVTFTTLRTGQALVFQKPAGQYVGFADNGTLKF
jgi:photosystem II stability/assembly factor-like uncharacterized protein